MTSKHVQTILEQPDAQLIIDKVKEVLILEEQKRHEFYEWLDEDKKAEFVNGQIIVHSPVLKQHTDATKYLTILLSTYVDLHDLGYVGFEKCLIRLTRNDYEPDVCFFNKEKSRDFKKDHKFYPAPDLVVEVLSSNEAHDRVTKFTDYQQHGILEYWIIDSKAQTIEQYILEDEVYHLKLKAKEEMITSIAVDGFSIAIPAVFDKEANLKQLRMLMSA